MRDWIPVFTGMTHGEGSSQFVGVRVGAVPLVRRLRFWVIAYFTFFFFSSSVSYAAPKAELWQRWEKHDPANTQRVDHSLWDNFLKRYLVAPHPSGINRLHYAAVSQDDRKALKQYLQSLQSLPISSYNRAEQKAFWINLYNAATVELILTRYPLTSIREINISPGLFAKGPWGAKFLTIEDEKLSLDDIEHRILRPIWKDNRIHYAVNCASLGCPNLQSSAYTAGNSESLLERGAKEYINHPRGVAINNGTLRVSSIYVWFNEDFGGNAEGLMEHWRKYADGPLAKGLQNYSGGLHHDYDWRLNGAEQAP